MKASLKIALGVLSVATALAAADRAGAGPAKLAAVDTCEIYGFVPHTRAYAACRMNVRHFWTSGPCGSNFFAAAHPGYCHLYPPHDF